MRNRRRLPEALTGGIAVSSSASEGRVENSGERYGKPEIEEPVPEDRYRGLGTNPEQGERGEHGHLEDTYAPGVSGNAAMVVATP